MSAPTVAARPSRHGTGLRPVPWRRMAGVTWRQHRTALVAVVACHPAGSPECSSLVDTFNGMDGFLWSTFPRAALLQLVPALIGAFAGAPVLARQLEVGTFRYAWTQGFGRWRWALAKLVLLGVLLVAAAGAFSVLVTWHFQPYFAAGNQALDMNEDSPFSVFNVRGAAFPAWTLAAFVIGALAGMLIRRVVPAIVATLAVYAGLAVAAGGFLREHYLTPLATSNPNVPGNAWVISKWWTKDGRFAFAGNPPQPPPAVLLFRPARAGRQALVGNIRAVPGSARLHTVDQLPAG